MESRLSRTEHERRDGEDQFRTRTIKHPLQSEVCVFGGQTLRRHSSNESMCGNKIRQISTKFKNKKTKMKKSWPDGHLNTLPSAHADQTFDFLNSSDAHRKHTRLRRVLIISKVQEHGDDSRKLAGGKLKEWLDLNRPERTIWVHIDKKVGRHRLNSSTTECVNTFELQVGNVGSMPSCVPCQSLQRSFRRPRVNLGQRKNKLKQNSWKELTWWSVDTHTHTHTCSDCKPKHIGINRTNSTWTDYIKVQGGED